MYATGLPGKLQNEARAVIVVDVIIAASRAAGRPVSFATVAGETPGPNRAPNRSYGKIKICKLNIYICMYIDVQTYRYEEKTYIYIYIDDIDIHIDIEIESTQRYTYTCIYIYIYAHIQKTTQHGPSF